MAHQAQAEFLRSCFSRFVNLINSTENILEVGSQNLNGQIRDYFPSASLKNWLGIDIGAGDGVDFIVPGELIQLPSGWADVSVSAECFEHALQWRQIFKNMIRITRPGGLILLTFAGPGRPAHGTLDTDPASSPYTSTYYKNISPQDILSSLELDKYFLRYSIELNQESCDTFFWGIRSSCLEGSEWISNEESLARARGQMGVLVNANIALERELSRYKMLRDKPLIAIYSLFLAAYSRICRRK